MQKAEKSPGTLAGEEENGYDAPVYETENPAGLGSLCSK